MSLLSILLISFSLAMDAFAVSVSAGLSSRKASIFSVVLLAGTFGIFQAVMPLIGWVWGYSIREYIEPIDHWIAFLLLGFIGINMIREALQGDDEEKKEYFSFRSLMTLGLATSIDALAVGISLAIIPVNILIAVCIIWGITFLLCFGWVYVGMRFGHIFEKKAEILWGIILLLIGSKILAEHLFF